MKLEPAFGGEPKALVRQLCSERNWTVVLRQNLVRAENGLIPRCNDLHTYTRIEPEAFLIA